MLKRVVMVAGEASGDLHGSGVVRELRARIPDIDVSGIGGDRMAAEGMRLIHHIESLSVMGFAEVIRHLPLIRRAEQAVREVLRTTRPQVVVLIDYPGFNLRVARSAKALGIPVLYYISPQIWAWNRRRITSIKSLVNEINVILPFEETMYRDAGVPVKFVGHPLLERLTPTGPREEFFRAWDFDPARKLVGLFPGSREQEIRLTLPAMLAAAADLRSRHNVQVAIGASGTKQKGLIERQAAGAPVTVMEGATYPLMEHADAAAVTSGTATLETAWYGTPMVVVYRTSMLTYILGRMLVRIPHIGLVNIVSGRSVVPELIQGSLTARNLVTHLEKMVFETEYAASIRRELSGIRRQMGSPGASAKVAGNIIALAGS